VTPVNVFKAVLLDTPAPPHDFRPNVPKALETIALRCLEKEPAKRYATAAALAADLDAFLVASVALTPEPDAERSTRGSRQFVGPATERPSISLKKALAICAGLAAMLGGLAFLFWPDSVDSLPPRSHASTVAPPPAPAAPDLEVSVVPIVIPLHGGLREARAGVGELTAVREGDGIRFEVELSAAAHLYLFNVDGAGKAFCLFPTAYADYYQGLVASRRLDRLPLENPIPRGRALIPTPLPEIDAPQAWFQFDATRGLERYYLFAADEPIAELEALADQKPGDEAAAAQKLVHAVEATRGSHRIVTGTSPAEIRLPEAPERKLDAIAARLRGRVVVWEYSIPHE
jgi:hypothetical protein